MTSEQYGFSEWFNKHHSRETSKNITMTLGQWVDVFWDLGDPRITMNSSLSFICDAYSRGLTPREAFNEATR